VRLWAKYLWFWLGCLVSVLLYIPLAFLVRGNITRDLDSWWRLRLERRDTHSDNPAMGRLFFFMLMCAFHPCRTKNNTDTYHLSYPLSNVILIAPLSIVRWIELAGSAEISSVASIAVGIVFGFDGLVNVLLILYCRPNLLLFGRDEVHCKCCAGVPPSPPLLPRTSIPLVQRVPNRES
jgi:hypothetical protein